MTTSALAPWFGSNRLLAPKVGEVLEGCKWCGVIFAGGMAEVPQITARTIVVNDKHRLVINLARVVADDALRPSLVRHLSRKAFHPDELKACQDLCNRTGLLVAHNHASMPDLALAEAYFVCSWMGRNGRSGTDDEFNGGLSTRWNASGGDSAIRYYNAVRGLAEFSRTLRRCTFTTDDAFDMLARCEDAEGHGIYADPPFPGPGRKYRHNCGDTDAEEAAWHTRLRDALVRFEKTRVVCRFYRHPLIESLYPESKWQWNVLTGGKKQSNEAAPEVLLVLNPKAEPSLF